MSANIITTVGIFLVLQLVASVWWASHTTTLLNVMQREMKEVLTELKAMRDGYVTKADFKTKCAILEKEHEAMWKKIDKIEQVT